MTVRPLDGVACGFAVTYRLTRGRQPVSNFAVRVPTNGSSIGCINNSTVFGCVNTDDLQDGLCVGSQGPTGNEHDTCEDTYTAAYLPDAFRRFEIANKGPFCYDKTTKSYEVTVEVYGVEVVCGGSWAGKVSRVCGNCSAPFDFVSATNVSGCGFPSEGGPCPCPLPSSPASDDSTLSGGQIGGIAAGNLNLSISLQHIMALSTCVPPMYT